MEELMLSKNYHDKKILKTPTCDIRSTEQLFRYY